jgi:hypothetical protein
MSGRVALEQAIINHKKIVRNAIRLKHSIEADNELNIVMPMVEARLNALAQQGLIPTMSITEVLDFAANGEAARGLDA